MYPQLRWLLLCVPFYAIKTTVGRVIPEPLCLNNSGSDKMKMTMHDMPSYSVKQCSNVQGGSPLKLNKQTLFSLHLLGHENKGDKNQQKSGRIRGRTRSKSTAYLSAMFPRVTTLRLPAQEDKTDKIANHHPVQVLPAHELHS